MLWVACQFPSLALEVPAGAADVARVAVDGTVLQACPLARAAGVRPGMRVASARALISPLEVRITDCAARGRALADLAPRLATITSQVVLLPEADTLLGEIGASQRLFGGLSGARRAVHAVLDDAGVTWTEAIAPTPSAAAVLARHRPGASVTTLADLRAVLAGMPATVLPLSDSAHQLLRRIGARQVGVTLI